LRVCMTVEYQSTVSDGAMVYQSKGPLPGSGPEPFVNDGWA
jgi:hypothetical protein